jgi:hypothetical protein
MKSPFPGMDPYLEQPSYWSAVHNRLIVAIADDLVEGLSEQYRVEIEMRTYFSDAGDVDRELEGESILVGIPDVAITIAAQAELSPEPSGAVATLAPPIQAPPPHPDILPEQVTVPMTEEIIERYLEIRDVATGQVITAIELLSPKNKRTGEGRNAYERKRNRILNSQTHLVEIDLLRGGKPLSIESQNLDTYRILISPSDWRPKANLYAFGLWDRIPTVTIPLRPSERPLTLNLQALVNRVYDRGRYGLAIDYQRSLTPVLSPGDRQKLQQFLELANR